MEFIKEIGGGVGVAALVGIAVNLYRAWRQSIADAVARGIRHDEMIVTMREQTEALSHLGERVSIMEERTTALPDLTHRMAVMDARLEQVEDHVKMVSEVLRHG